MIFTRQDHERLDAILREAARCEVMPRFRRLAAGDIRAKQNPVDVVTEADEAAERFICAELAKAFPGAALIGEEAVTQDPSLLSKLSEAEIAFVIDPIDGTLNYASDLSLFAVMATPLAAQEAESEEHASALEVDLALKQGGQPGEDLDPGRDGDQR